MQNWQLQLAMPGGLSLRPSEQNWERNLTVVVVDVASLLINFDDVVVRDVVVAAAVVAVGAVVASVRDQQALCPTLCSLDLSSLSKNLFIYTYSIVEIGASLSARNERFFSFVAWSGQSPSLTSDCACKATI